MAERKRVRRDDISQSALKKLLKRGAGAKFTKGVDSVRTSEDALEQTQKATEAFLRHVGEKAVDLIKYKKAKTVKLETLQEIAKHLACKGIKASDLQHEVRAGAGQRGLSQAGVVRVFQQGFGDNRISEDSKEALVGMAEAYVMKIGANAGIMAVAARRTTLQGADVVAAIKTLEH